MYIWNYSNYSTAYLICFREKASRRCVFTWYHFLWLPVELSRNLRYVSQPQLFPDLRPSSYTVSSSLPFGGSPYTIVPLDHIQLRFLFFAFSTTVSRGLLSLNFWGRFLLGNVHDPYCIEISSRSKFFLWKNHKQFLSLWRDFIFFLCGEIIFNKILFCGEIIFINFLLYGVLFSKFSFMTSFFTSHYLILAKVNVSGEHEDIKIKSIVKMTLLFNFFYKWVITSVFFLTEGTTIKKK